MSVYSKNGEQLFSVYAKNGSALNQAYNISGNQVFGNGKQLTLMQYNVGQWFCGTGNRMTDDLYPTYSALHRGIMETEKPDLVSFQEWCSPVVGSHTSDEMIGEYFTAEVHHDDFPYMGKAIYTKGLPLSNDSYFQFSSGTGFGCLKVKTVIEGKEVWVYSPHFYSNENGLSKRAEEATQILSEVANLDYFIILGDLNVYCHDVENEEYKQVMKLFVDAGYNVANCSPQFGFIETFSMGTSFSGVYTACPDSIITSPNIVINSVHRNNAKLEAAPVTGYKIDHCPLVVKVTVY